MQRNGTLHKIKNLKIQNKKKIFFFSIRSLRESALLYWLAKLKMKTKFLS
jgi:hypothetical protein